MASAKEGLPSPPKASRTLADTSGTSLASTLADELAAMAHYFPEQPPAVEFPFLSTVQALTTTSSLSPATCAVVTRSVATSPYHPQLVQL